MAVQALKKTKKRTEPMNWDDKPFYTKHEFAILERIIKLEEAMVSMDKRFELLIHQMDKRFEQVDKRFEQMDKRFEQVEKHLNRLFILIGAGFSFIALLITILKFLNF